MAPSRGPSGLYNKSYGPNFDKDRFRDRDHDRFSDRDRDHRFSDRDRDHDRFSDRDHDRHLFNRADRDHDFDRDRHHGVVSGNFFEHGRHFRFRRFFHGEWVFLSDWDDCTAWAWVHVAPGVWAWRPVNICIG
jgi:hypothetical protein